MTNSNPFLAGFSNRITIDEELANLGPQLLDADVTFSDVDDNFDGETLVMSGLLTEDIISLRDQGTGANEISLDGTFVTFAGITIGTATGGIGGTDFSVTFNVNATSLAIDALIENLTYENLSDTPTATRVLDLIITDADGAVALQPVAFTFVTGPNDPFNGIDNGNNGAPVLIDLDGDGDLDLVNGEGDGNLNYYENIGTALAPIFAVRFGGLNPFFGIDVGSISMPTFLDIDYDGDQDLVVGGTSGDLTYYENIGTAIEAAYTLRINAADPFDGINRGNNSTPVFVDIDGDGDQDLVFGENNGNLNYYENTGTALAASYTLRTGAADPFDGVNHLFFSAPTIIDFDNDGDQDIVIGNGGGNLRYFENTGTALVANFVLRNGTANPLDGIRVGSSSTPNFADIDHDGDQDIVIGGNDGVLHSYINYSDPLLTNFIQRTGASDPFDFISSNSRSTPGFLDIDNDGDEDLVIGEGAGNLKYYENTGTVFAPIFTLITGAADPFNSINVGPRSSPSFIDINNDGDEDLVIGEDDGTLNYYENTGSAFTPVFTVRTGAANPFDGIDIGRDSAPRFIDIDNDGDKDLVIGESDGTLNYYENTGSAFTPVFTVRTGAANPFDGIDIGSISKPSFIDFDNDGDDDLVIGEFFSTLIYYENTGTALVPAFTLRSGAANPFEGIIVGSISAPNFIDTDNDGDKDLVIGDDFGHIHYYENTNTALTPTFTLRAGAADPFVGKGSGSRSTPRFIDIDNDGDDDLVVGDNGGTLNYYENTGTSMAPIFTLQTGAASPFDGIGVGFRSAPSFIDIDNDGDQDLVIGEFNSTLNYYENTGSVLAPVFTQRTGADNPFGSITSGNNGIPSFVDLDNDGDQDLVIGEIVDNLKYYENIGTAFSPEFTLRTGVADPFDGIDIGSSSAPSFFDFDNDGDEDLVIGEQDGNLNYFENIGTALAPLFTLRTGVANPFDGIDIGSNSVPVFTDIDNDGDVDLIIGELAGTLNYYENTGNGFKFVLNVTPHADPSSGADVMNGTPGNDTIDGLSGNDIIRGHDGNDNLDGSEGYDILYGNDGDDTLSGGLHADDLFGGAGHDELYGGADRDKLDGGTGADTMYGGEGNDIYYIDDVGDTVSEAVGEGYDIVHATGIANFTLGANVERIIFDDTINHVAKGNALDNRLNGNAGKDKFLIDEGGADIFSGGSSRDVFDARASSTGIKVYLNNQDNNAGATAGDFFASIEVFSGSSTASDTMRGGTGRSRFAGNGGDDILIGNNNIDFLQGGADNDTIYGGSGRDTLQGGRGDDLLDGGNARDQFLYVKADFGHDTIVDFQDGLDYFKVWSGNNPSNGVADDISDFTITGNGTSTVTVTLNSDPTSIITVNSFDGNAMTIDAGDFQFY